MSDNKQNNKRIAKNALLMYIRMLIIMIVNLYTSRVILDALGVTDYGVFSVIGGVVSLFGIISNSLSAATQRFITYGLGKNNQEYLNKIFSTSIFIHFAICTVFLILAETIGLWFMNNEMQIPADRLNAAFWVFQSTIASSIIMIMSVPYNATIIAHEKMSAFAMISLLEVFLKLGIVYLLFYISGDKLIVYALLLLITQIFIRLCYTYYCKKHFKETKIRFVKDTKLIKEIWVFSSWSLFGNTAYISYTQGLNILLNVFFNPTVNAARGIAVQVQSAVNHFVTSFHTAINPQITKSYAAGNISSMQNLVFKSAKFSYYMLFLLSLPIILECETILKLWLKIVPDYTIVFLRLILLTTLINAIANPLIISVKATGKIKTYEVVVGGLMIMILPISYVVLKLGYPPYAVFIVHLFIEIIAQVFRVWITKRLIGFSIKQFFNSVILRIMLVSVIAVTIPLLVHNSLDNSIISFIIVCVTSILFTCLVILIFGLTQGERNMIFGKIRMLCKRIKC